MKAKVVTEYPCAYCGKMFVRHNGGHKFCCRSCAYQWHIKYGVHSYKKPYPTWEADPEHVRAECEAIRREKGELPVCDLS